MVLRFFDDRVSQSVEEGGRDGCRWKIQRTQTRKEFKSESIDAICIFGGGREEGGEVVVWIDGVEEG